MLPIPLGMTTFFAEDGEVIEVELRLDAVCAHVERVAELREARVLRTESHRAGQAALRTASRLLHRAFERCAGRAVHHGREVGKARGAT